MDENDIPFLGGPTGRQGKFKPQVAKWDEEAIQHVNTIEKWAVVSMGLAFVFLFLFWPLAVVFFFGSMILTFIPGEEVFLPGYVGECPACNGLLVMGEDEEAKNCRTCQYRVIRKGRHYKIV